jgi:hypothetical protein
MAQSEQLPGTSVPVGEAPAGGAKSPNPGQGERLPISEVAYDRPGGPSPFGDDQVFPLPVDQLRYTPTTAP